MSLLTPGYFPDTYFPKDYWADDYWLEYAIVLPVGYWHTTYFPKNYWADDYWPHYGPAPSNYVRITQASGEILWIDDSDLRLTQISAEVLRIVPEATPAAGNFLLCF